jgi:hypothetical protein
MASVVMVSVGVMVVVLLVMLVVIVVVMMILVVVNSPIILHHRHYLDRHHHHWIPHFQFIPQHPLKKAVFSQFHRPDPMFRLRV